MISKARFRIFHALHLSSEPTDFRGFFVGIVLVYEPTNAPAWTCGDVGSVIFNLAEEVAAEPTINRHFFSSAEVSFGGKMTSKSIPWSINGNFKEGILVDGYSQGAPISA